MPDEINCIFKILYIDFHLSIITNDFHSKYVVVKRGVLQGDLLSPLIFKIIMKTFIQCVKEEKLTNFGYRAFQRFLPRNWIQSTDDNVTVTFLKEKNQILLNIFSKWCRWSEISN